MHNYGVYEAFNQNAEIIALFLEFRRQLGIKLLSSHKYYKKRNCMITMTIKHSTKIEKIKAPG